MNSTDIVLGVLLLLAFYSGFKKGLFVTLASLIGLLAGIYGAVYFSDFAGAYIARWFNWTEQTTKWAAFAVTFLVIVFVLHFIGKFLTKIADFAALGLLNKLLGGVFSALQYAVILSVIFLFFKGSNLTGYIIPQEKKESSILYAKIEPIAPWILPTLIEEFQKIKPETSEDKEDETNM